MVSGFSARSHLGRIVVSGADRASYLQGLLTNDVVALKGGQGCYAAYLTAQGRMITDLHVYELGDVMLLTLPLETKDGVLAKFDRFIFSEDVQLGDVSDTYAQIAIVGPEASAIVATTVVGTALSGPSVLTLSALPEHGNVRVDSRFGPAIVTRVMDTGEPGYDVFVDRAQADGLRAALVAAGVAEMDEATAEVFRIEAGVPLFGRDMDEETIPLEAGIESRAISFTKGCYVGQEVIIRVMHRGHGRVARKLVGLAIEGDLVPAPGAVVRAAGKDDKEVGRVTSSALSRSLKRPIALAYVHRDFVEAGTKVSVDDASATVTALPFA